VTGGGVRDWRWRALEGTVCVYKVLDGLCIHILYSIL
jgi:hypothetical protein